MSMEMTWLQFQLSSDNQNGRHLIFFQLFFKNSLETWYIHIGFWGLRVYYLCPFSCETENEAAAAILVLSILINRSYFQLIALKACIYNRVTASAEGYLSAFFII